jgi:phosphatidylinositol glycan class A protein
MCVCASHPTHTHVTRLLSSVCAALRSVSVIPNAVDATRFTPDPSARPPHRVVVVCMSRLVYRKGVDLIAAVVPIVCAAAPHVDFVIGGDGPKRGALEAMLARGGPQLALRVTLLGDVPHSRVIAALRAGHVFLNASLTESFCMAVLEAACCGMLVVATAVGGVPEVLPPHIMRLAPPAPQPLADAVLAAVAAAAATDAWAQHAEVREMYSWEDVAARVERVYDKAAASRESTLGRLRRLARCGPWAGPLFAGVALADALYMRYIVAFTAPEEDVDEAPDAPQGGALRERPALPPGYDA